MRKQELFLQFFSVYFWQKRGMLCLNRICTAQMPGKEPFMERKHTVRSRLRAHKEALGWGATVLGIAALLALTVWATPDLRQDLLPAYYTAEEAAQLTAEENMAAQPQAGAVLPPAETADTAEVAPVQTQPPAQTDAPSAYPQVPDDTVPVLADPSVSAAIEAAQPPDLLPPVAYTALQRGYGYGYNPNTEDYRFHRGSDLPAAEGTAVAAAVAGTVAEAYEDAYWGGVVVLAHEGGWHTVYRCLAPAVKVGDAVEAGSCIGYVAAAPAEAVQESHLHLELEKDGESRDPAAYLLLE